LLGKGKKDDLENQEIKSILAEGLRVEGNVKAQGKIRIDGQITGDVEGEFILFGKSASVKGNVSAKKVVLMGTVEGDLIVDSLELKSTARVKGNLTVKELTVEPGASMEGSVRSGSFLSQSSKEK